jgi:hypothetical protein
MKLILSFLFYLTNASTLLGQDTLYHKWERTYEVSVIKDSFDYLIIANVKKKNILDTILRYEMGIYLHVKIFDVNINNNYFVCIYRQGLMTGFIVYQYAQGRWHPHMGNIIVTDGNWTKPFTISLQGYKKIRIEQGRRIVVYKLDFKNRTARKVRDNQRE